MQNQSKITSQFFDAHKFEEIPVFPISNLWIDHPDTNTCWMHAHDHIEIGRCVKGSGIFNIDGKVHRLNAPCSMIVYEGEYHSAQSNSLDPCECNYLYLDLNAFLSKIDESTISKIKGLEWQNYDFNNIFDNKKVLTGSTNISSCGTGGYNNNNMLLINSESEKPPFFQPYKHFHLFPWLSTHIPTAVHHIF